MSKQKLVSQAKERVRVRVRTWEWAEDFLDFEALPFELCKIVDLDIARDAGHRLRGGLSHHDNNMLGRLPFRALVDELEQLGQEERVGDDGRGGVLLQDRGEEGRGGEGERGDGVRGECEVGDDELERVVQQEEDGCVLGLEAAADGAQEPGGECSCTVLEVRVCELWKRVVRE